LKDKFLRTDVSAHPVDETAARRTQIVVIGEHDGFGTLTAFQLASECARSVVDSRFTLLGHVHPEVSLRHLRMYYVRREQPIRW